MPMRRDCYPLMINLPDGRRAEYVAGSRPARYTIDGELSDIDATIPDDLLATGWYWSGSFLFQPWPERPDGPGVAISTGTYGLAETFEMARRMNAKRAELLALRVVMPAKKVKAKKKAITVPDVPPDWQPEPELAQAMMEF